MVYFAALTEKLRCCCYFIYQNSQFLELDWIFLRPRKTSEPLSTHCYLFEEVREVASGGKKKKKKDSGVKLCSCLRLILTMCELYDYGQFT